MRTWVKGLAALVALSLVVSAVALPAPSSAAPRFSRSVEAGQAGPKGGSGGSRAEQAGENAAELLQGWLGPLLLILIGALAVVALLQRNVGMAVSVAMIGLIGGLFIFSPGDAEALFKGIYDALF